jgi:hypothetical protein
VDERKELEFEKLVDEHIAFLVSEFCFVKSSSNPYAVQFDGSDRYVKVMHGRYELDWMSSIYNCGHWIPYQIAIAGGVDMLSDPSGYSIVTDWNKVVQYNPEVLVLAPCGFDVKPLLRTYPL